MRLAEGVTYKRYYCIIKHDDWLCTIIKRFDGFNDSTKLGLIDEKDILIFEKKRDATEWVEKNSYKGMSYTYEIKKLVNDKTTSYKWEVI